VNSSAPPTTTRIRPRLKASPPSARIAPHDAALAPAHAVVAKTPPSAMKAPASTARAKVLKTSIEAFCTPTSSARRAIAVGSSASRRSGMSVIRESPQAAKGSLHTSSEGSVPRMLSKRRTEWQGARLRRLAQRPARPPPRHEPVEIAPHLRLLSPPAAEPRGLTSRILGAALQASAMQRCPPTDTNLTDARATESAREHDTNGGGGPWHTSKYFSGWRRARRSYAASTCSPMPFALRLRRGPSVS
jgi:hypothetical protein